MKTINQRLSEFLSTYAAAVAADPVPCEKSQFVKNTSVLLRRVFAAHLKEERKLARMALRKRPLVPCTVDGVNYNYITDACAALNINHCVAINRLRSHYWPTWTSPDIKKEIRVREKKTKPLPCTIDGVKYVSIAEAARQLNISTGSVFYKLHSNAYPTWQVSE